MLNHRKQAIRAYESPVAAAHPAFTLSVPRQTWIEVCAERLAELSPLLNRFKCTAMASELWPDVGGYDPTIAAEMEHESGIFDD